MDTMKPDAQKNGKTPSDAKDLAWLEGTPVYELRFCVQGGRDLPLPDANGGMGTLRARDNRKITCLDRKPFYRVTETSRDKAPVTFFIPQSWATFQPFE